MVKYSELLFYLFFGLILSAKGVGFYDGQPVFKLILVIAVICLLGKLTLEQYSGKQIIAIIGLFIFGGATYCLSGEKGLLLNCMIMIGMHHIETKRVFRLSAIIWGSTFLITIVNALFHMEDTVYKVDEKLGLGHIFRWSLGYGHPNVLQITYFILAIIFIYLLGKDFKLWHAGLLFLGNCFFFLYSVSYTGFITVLLLIAGRIYLMYRPKLCFVEKMLLQLVFPLCIMISLIAPVALNGKAFQILNKLMNTRLALSKYFLTSDYVHLWGNRLADITTNSLTMDNSFVFAFVVYGIIPFIIIVVFTMLMISHLIKNEQYVELLIVLAMAIGGLTEPFLYNTSFKNLSFVFMGQFIFQHIKGNENYSMFAMLNKEINIPEGGLNKCFWLKCRLLECDIKKILFALIGSIFVCLVSNFAITYPKGYVVYRSDCSDLEKKFHYYGEEELEGYREMEIFQPGELVEYFSGNIVVVERIRNSTMAIFLGFSICFVVYGIGEILNERYRRLV